MKRILLFVLFLSGIVNAETRQRIELTWKHIPRENYEDTKMESTAPGATLTYSKNKNVQSFVIQFDTGITCSTGSRLDQLVYLGCGTNFGYYELTKESGKNATLDWVQIKEPVPPKVENN